jgi:uncharacterized protein YbbC (DUF1343 family)/CubicO group peptidase (beta-lactamase class C family)
MQGQIGYTEGRPEATDAPLDPVAPHIQSLRFLLRRICFPRAAARFALSAALTCVFLCSARQAVSLPTGSASAPAYSAARLTGATEAGARAIDFTGIDWLVKGEIAAGRIPGAVVLIGDADRVLYRRAFGYRARTPRPEPMTVDTIFDLASLTKVIATTTAVLQLVEDGRLGLDKSVGQYWSAFAGRGKAPITVRELLTHTSGLPADLDVARPWAGRRAALRLIEAERPRTPPGTRYLYSDINFIVLGELVRRISGMPLDDYCARRIFGPLGMSHTRFRPPASWRPRIAPTRLLDRVPVRGDVHDPTAARMGGIAGHAGLFSSADDLARFAQALLEGAELGGGMSRRPDVNQRLTAPNRVLTARMIRLMMHPERAGPVRFRGLGWDVAAPFVADRDALPPFGAFGHTGYTGTSLWIDPVSGLYLIVLTNRVYPDGRGDAQPLRRALAALLAASGHAPAPHPAMMTVSLRSAVSGGDSPEHGSWRTEQGGVESGVDVLVRDNFAELRGLRLGLITNQSGRAASGVRTVDLLKRAPDVRLVALFSPEHGLEGRLDRRVSDGTDISTGLPIYSLYGGVKRPTASMLEGLDALLFDVQDSGTRFFTYVTTMAYAMQAAARHGLRFFVIDRPDPIRADIVQGPLLDTGLESFTGFFPLPLRHGMTVGEIARLFNSEARIGAQLQVIAMRSYRRGAWYDETGLPWVPLSPNLRTVDEAALYPGVGMIEGANVSVGRGTDTPFEMVGAPWINSRELTRYLDRREIPGVRFVPERFVPSADRYAGRVCSGVRILLIDRSSLQAGRLGVELASALHRLYPQRFELEGTLSLIGSRSVLIDIERGKDPIAITHGWQQSLRTFRSIRRRYLLYPDTPSSSSGG